MVADVAWGEAEVTAAGFVYECDRIILAATFDVTIDPGFSGEGFVRGFGVRIDLVGELLVAEANAPDPKK